MKHYKFTFTFLIVTLLLAGFTSCTETSEAETAQNEMSSEELETLSKLDTIKITLNSNDKMQFDKSEITVFEGQTIVLTLYNAGTMSVMAMGHNFVLLSKGTSLSTFARLAMSERDNQYIPKNNKDVIAHTALIGGGENTSVTFTAPKKGTYDFVCSFPGHYSIMKGKFYVK